jgi:hypothetical protein
MNMFTNILTLSMLGIIAYTYFGYALILWLAVKIKKAK